MSAALATFKPPLAAWENMKPLVGAQLAAGAYYIVATDFTLVPGAQQTWRLEEVDLSYRAGKDRVRVLRLPGQVAVAAPTATP